MSTNQASATITITLTGTAAEVLDQSNQVLHLMLPWPNATIKFESTGNHATTTETDKLLEQKIEFLNLSERPRNALRRAQIDTVGQLVQKTEAELMQLTDFGDKCRDEVTVKLDDHELKLRDPHQLPTA